jgi:protein phosphatase 1 regulatory subunit 7
VANLAVDCLHRAVAVDALSELTELESLDLGVYEGVPIDILDSKNFFGLKALSLSESKGRKLDLSPLSKYANLQKLFVAGQGKGIDAIGSLNSLESLGLSMIGKKFELAFISKLPVLRRLKLLLGGRENLNEIASPSLERLEVCRLQGLMAIELSNFPRLTEVDIEDQPRMTTLDLTGLERLTRFRLANCPHVSVLSGLSSLHGIKAIHIYRTALDFERLLSDGLPRTLEKFNFYSMSAKQDRSIQEKLASLGLWAKGA